MTPTEFKVAKMEEMNKRIKEAEGHTDAVIKRCAKNLRGEPLKIPLYRHDAVFGDIRIDYSNEEIEHVRNYLEAKGWHLGDIETKKYGGDVLLIKSSPFVPKFDNKQPWWRRWFVRS